MPADRAFVLWTRHSKITLDDVVEHCRARTFYVQATVLLALAEDANSTGNWALRCRGLHENLPPEARDLVASVLRTLVEILEEPQEPESRVPTEPGYYWYRSDYTYARKLHGGPAGYEIFEVYRPGSGGDFKVRGRGHALDSLLADMEGEWGARITRVPEAKGDE